jgi:N-acetylneuraminic acid mutarotase
MNVTINNVVVRQNFDVFATTGCRTALIEEYPVSSMSTGAIRVQFVAIQDNAMVSLLQVVKQEKWRMVNEDQNYVSRHECSFVQAGNKFYMFGGRESPMRVDTYDFTTNTWTKSASVPLTLNHFQAIKYQGLVWVIGAFQDNKFPQEKPATRVYVFDPASNVWMLGPLIPEARRRGSAGLAVYQEKFYLVGGNTVGHKGRVVGWIDEYDPRTASWKQMTDAPRQRDHFHATVVGNRLYAVGGRRTTEQDIYSDTEAVVDVYDFNLGKWLEPSLVDNLPIPRAGAATAVYNDQILIMGGESGLQAVAHSEVHALNTTTGKWSSLAPLNHGRHGTQAIVSGGRIYITGGSPVRMGGNQRNMERYGDANSVPIDEAGTAGVLFAPSVLDISAGEPTIVTIAHVGGSQGVFVTSVKLTGQNASDFAITNFTADPHLIGREEKRDVLIKYNGSIDGAKAELNLIYNGNNVLKIDLTSRLPPPPTTSTTTTTTTSTTTSTLYSPPNSTRVEMKRVFFANAGVSNEDMSTISGRTSRWGRVVAIANTDTPEIFQTHRYGSDFAYTIGNLTPANKFRVTIGFSEIYDQNCLVGKRVFDILINNIIVKSNLDVFASAGCRTAHLEYFNDTVADEAGRIKIGFRQTLEKAMVSYIEVQEPVVIQQTTAPTEASMEPITTITTTTTPLPTREITINAGASGENISLVTGTSGTFSKLSLQIKETPNDISPSTFKTHRWGANFTYTLKEFAPFQPVTIVLGFAETYAPNCAPGMRLMDIHVNGILKVSQLDVFSAAAGCLTAHLETITAVADLEGNVALSFLRKRENAMVSYIHASTAMSS